MGNEAALKLAYEASVRAIDDQARVLEGLRSRGGTMFAAGALVTSFLGGQVFAKAAHFKPISFAGAGVACFVVAALFTLVILWPFRFGFSLSASEIIEIVDEREAAGATVSESEAYRELALRLEVNYDRNSPKIQVSLWCFRLAILALVGEVAMLITALWRA